MTDLLNPVNLLGVLFEIFIKSLFALSIIRALEEISPNNRRISPALVWLLVIPGFNLVWNFFVAIRLSQSFKNELAERDFEVTSPPTLLIGLAYAIISSAALFIPVPKDLSNSYLYGILGIAAIILFIQYWTKINWYKRILQNDTEEDQSTEQL